MGPTRRNVLSQGLLTLRGAFFVVGAFSLFINLAALIVPLYMLQIYDRVLASQSRETLVAITALALALLVTVIFVEIARSRVLVRVGAELDATLGAPLFATAIDGQASDQQTSASQPLRDLDTLRVFMTGSGILALFDAPWTPIYLAIVYLFHPWLGAVATVGTLIILALAIASEIAVRGPLREAGSSTRWSNELVEIFARSSNSIRVMGMLNPLQALWQKSSARRGGLAGTCQRSPRYPAGGSKERAALVAGGSARSGCVARHRRSHHRWDHDRRLNHNGPGSGAGRSGTWAMARICKCSSRVPQVKRNPRAARVLAEPMPLPAPLGRLEVDNVGLRHAERVPPVLSGVTFTIEPGETLGIIGPSGAGKSSLARLLVGIGAPNLGSVRLDGVEVSSWPKEELGRYLGYLPQEIELLGGTVAQNICRFGSVESDAIVAAAKLAGAHDMILRLPEGYDTIIENGGRNVAGGARQRLGLARALFGDTRLVILDEPNANLDAAGEAALVRALSILKQHKRTVIVITHKPALLGGADKLLVLSQGRVTLFGPSESVLTGMTARARKNGKITSLPRRPSVPNSAESNDAQGLLHA